MVLSPDRGIRDNQSMGQCGHLALAALYDAALSPERWPNALDAVASEIGAAGLILVAVDQVGLPFKIETATSGYTLERIGYYFKNFGQFDEPIMSQTLAATPPKRLLRDCDVWGDIALLEDRPDYKWMREQYGVLRRAGIRLSNNKGWMDLLALQIDKDWNAVTIRMTTQLGILVPHLAKVVEINRSFSVLRSRYQAVLSALDYVKIGTCIVGEKGQLFTANREAQRILDRSDGLWATAEGTLACPTSDETSLLLAKIRSIAATADGTGDCHEEMLISRRRSDGRRLLIELAPLRDSAGELERGLSGVILFIIDPDNRRTIAIDRLSQLFNLGQAERDVCRGLIDGQSLSEIAKARDVSEETIKTQVKSVYAKTGVHRRVDLVRLAVVIDPPVDL